MTHTGTNAYGKAGRLVTLLAILAWATQLIWTQCAGGQEVFATDPSAPQPAAEEHFAQGGAARQDGFVPGTPRFLAGATLEMIGEATIVGGDVKLRQVCRWSKKDQAAFEPIADLVIARVGAGTAFRAVTLKELKSTLSDAGVNLAVIRFAGTTHCTITRSDATSDERASLQEWVNARLAQGASTQPVVIAAAKPQAAAVAGDARTAAAVQPAAAATGTAAGEARTLRQLLIADLADRLSLDPANIQVRFNVADERLLKLAEPLFRFNVDGQRIHNLGEVAWEVAILTDSGAKAPGQKVMIRALAKAWQDQLVVRMPMAYHQAFRTSDIMARRALVDQLEPDAALTADQVLGQQAARELRSGTVLTSKLVEAMPLAKIGDLLTVTLEQGNVQITTVARAMEGGSYGQTVRAKQEGSGAVLDVTLTGPKAGRMTPMTPTPPERATAKISE
jgi:flagella basal body P-ring formation protein FlgA